MEDLRTLQRSAGAALLARILAVPRAFLRRPGPADTMPGTLHEENVVSLRPWILGGLAVVALLAPPVHAGDGGSFTMLFVGDVMLARKFGPLTRKNADPAFPFRPLEEQLRGADLTFGNLECPLSVRGTRRDKPVTFRGHPRMVKGLAWAGFDVLGVANNHIYDYGADAAADTLRLLKRAGISPVGAGRTAKEAHAPVLRTVQGTTVAFLAYTNLLSRAFTGPEARPSVAFLDRRVLRADIARARKQADLVVVSVHWGREYRPEPTELQRKFAHLAIEDGAALVIGHHPHVAQPVERYRDGYVAYSLGNFVFDQAVERLRAGVMLRVTVQDKAIRAVETIPVHVNDQFQATRATPEVEHGGSAALTRARP